MKIDNLISSHDHLNPCLLFHNSYFHRFSPFPLLNHYIFFILFLSLVIPLNYDILFLCNIFSPSLYSSFSLSLLHFFSPSLLSSFSLSFHHFFSTFSTSLIHSFTPLKVCQEAAMGPIRELGPAALLKVRPEDVRALTEVVRTHQLANSDVF